MSGETRAALLGPMRLPFLILTPACVAVGAATASWQGHDLNLLHLALVLVGAVAAHISVNAFNEYDDFKSGLDLETERTLFSGGSGALPANPEKAGVALATAVVALLVTIGVGLFFVWVRGWMLLPLGALGVIVIVAYTRLFTKNATLCLVAPGLGFGPLMVLGTHFALTGTTSWTAAIASLVPLFLVSDLLFLNQFPDIEADRTVGRSHLPMLIGRRRSAVVYGLLLAGAYLAVIAGLITELLPIWSALALGSLVIAIPTAVGVRRNADEIPALVPYMGRNVLINLLTPALLALGLFIS